MPDFDLKIRFQKSTSPNYKTVLKLSKQFNTVTQNENTTEIALDHEELFSKRKYLTNLINYISSWKYTNIILDHDIIDSSKIYAILNILDCSEWYKRAMKGDTYCFLDGQIKEGWRCKYISVIKRHLPESSWEYNRNSGKYWFDFGNFDNNGDWIINKDDLKSALSLEADRQKLYICPYFNMNKIDKIISSFPDKIELENNNEWSVYEKEIDDGYVTYKKKIGIIPKKVLDENGNVLDNGYFGIRVGISTTDNKTNEDVKEINRNIPSVSFADIGGLDDILTVIREIIELPIKSPGLFEHLGIVPHKGILLYGPPGCGKTLIAKAIANEIKAHFINIKGPELLNKYIGQSEENLRNVFEEAKELQPTIIFFDEIDAIGQSRSSEENVRYSSQFLNQLLTLMDGVEDYGNIRILASTNRPELLDTALLRPGRFDYHIEIKKPTLQGCKQIFSIYTSKMPISDNFKPERFAEKLLGYTGAEIAFLARESAYNCIRRNINVIDVIENNETINYDYLIISEIDFLYALDMLKEKNGII